MWELSRGKMTDAQAQWDNHFVGVEFLKTGKCEGTKKRSDRIDVFYTTQGQCFQSICDE